MATTVKQSYQYLLTPVIKKYSITDETFERYVERFNADLKEILQVCVSINVITSPLPVFCAVK